MLAYFMVGMVLAAALCFGAYWLIQQKVLEETLSLDDGKGYFLVACILIGFVLALGGFYTGQTLGYDQQEASSTLMALAILLYIMVTMLTLIFGLVKFREPEHY
ncbi:MAG: hypothetical protein CMI02_14105 [Oceanospirillaceae bacterium]|nr:hypothetical protein [Oceanospirillaceae bacterium]MBT13157.1 hypothetical protein [Oceanospirillaceae bacterium]|tara:strand:- start:15432 stop:15743 length:312 start_codon:yes stop_codon:yes gene_type:complete